MSFLHCSFMIMFLGFLSLLFKSIIKHQCSPGDCNSAMNEFFPQKFFLQNLEIHCCTLLVHGVNVTSTQNQKHYIKKQNKTTKIHMTEILLEQKGYLLWNTYGGEPSQCLKTER